MTDPNALYLYEEVMLLALRDEEGTVVASFLEHAVGGAVLAELLLDQRISVDRKSGRLVNLLNAEDTGDPVIDACLEKMRAAKRRASLQTWVTRFAGIKDLKHKVALQLCERGIIKADQDKVLFVFPRKIYPEINPEPEEAIIERLKAAIFSDLEDVDARTIVLISLANGAELLGENLGHKEVRQAKKRIEQIIKGEVSGNATRDVIEACEAATMVATLIPLFVAGTAS